MPKFYKISSTLMLALVSIFVLPAMASAHIVVSPNQVVVGKRQVFSVGVPNESDTAQVINVRLVIPENLESVVPNTKPGWTIEIKKLDSGDDAKITEIIWSGGSIPQGQRDDFLFQAKAPSKTSELGWKAYETYSDGKVVAWDQEPKVGGHSEDSKPYSVTKVIDDFDVAATTAPAVPSASNVRANLALAVGGLGLLIATGLATKRYKK